MNRKPVTKDDKRIILADSDVLQLLPLRYKWAWEYYLLSNKNHWLPNDISMAPDVADWNDRTLPQAYRHRFETVLAQLTTFDIQRGFDLSESLIPLIDAPELKMFLVRQAYEEMLHTHSYQYCIENMGMDESRIYNMYRTVDVLNARVEYAAKFSSILGDMTREDLKTQYAREQLLISLVFWFLIFEGIWFALNLAGPVQAIARFHRRFTATAEQFQYILRDETVHINFGVMLINEFKTEHPETWNRSVVSQIVDLFHHCMELEREFITYACQYQSTDYSVADHMEMAYFYANRRASSIGIEPPLYPHAKCTLPWMHEMVGALKERNFFETRVLEYQKSALNLDDIDHSMPDIDWTEV